MKSRFIREAYKESLASDYHHQHLGAVAVYADKVILARAHNTERTNPTQWKYNRFRKSEELLNKPQKGHAEMGLYRKIRYLDIDFSLVSVYIYREHADKTYALARPCDACERALRDLGIKKVYYTTENGISEEKYL